MRGSDGLREGPGGGAMMERARIAMLAGIALAFAALVPGCMPTSSEGATAGALHVNASPVTITPAELSGLELVSAFQLSAEHDHFGGFSGLSIRDGRLVTVTDMGWLLSADLATMTAGGEVDFRPLPGESGRGTKATSDAESLAPVDGGLAIGFEQDHRIEIIRDGRIVEVIRDRRFRHMRGNNGLEALAALPDGGLLAIGETAAQRSFPVFVIRPDRQILAGGLPQIGRHAVSGADIGPDGRLYLLRRDWSLLRGFSIRIERYRLEPSGAPDPASREVLAAFESGSGIDNMEGISAWRGADGVLHLAIMADDNFNPLERTLLLIFDVAESGDAPQADRQVPQDDAVPPA